MILLLYVDDILLDRNDLTGIKYVKALLSALFKLKDLGLAKFFLIMEIARARKCISLSQRNYTLELLSDVGLLVAKPVLFPMDTHTKLSKEDSDIVDDISTYKRLIGILLYLTHTRPNITYAFRHFSHFGTILMYHIYKLP